MMSWPYSPRTRMRPIGPRSPIPVGSLPRASLAGGQSDRSGRWPSRVWTTSRPAPRAASRTRRVGSMARRKQRDVVAERFAEAARIDEVALHVDDDQRGGAGLESKGVRFRNHGGHGVSWDASVRERYGGATAGALCGDGQIFGLPRWAVEPDWPLGPPLGTAGAAPYTSPYTALLWRTAHAQPDFWQPPRAQLRRRRPALTRV